MITIGELVKDPCFCTEFEVQYLEGKFNKGRFEDSVNSINVIGVARPASSDDLDMLEEADKVRGGMTFYTNEPVIISNEKPAPRIKWHNRLYKIIHTEDFVESGFFKSIGTLMEGGDV